MSAHLATAAHLLRQGQPARAIPFLRAAAAESPQNPTLHHDLGLACLEAGDLGGAIAALRDAIALHPRYRDAHLRLGIAYDMNGQADAALAAFRAANSADALYRAADMLENLGRDPESADFYRRTAAASPRTTLGRIAAARAARLCHDDAAAEKKLRQALLHDKANPIALDLLGTLLAEHGRFAEAEPLFAAALEAAPDRPGCVYDLLRCRRITPADLPLLGRLNNLAARPGLDPIARARLHLGLAKAAADLNDPATAARHATAGQALRDTLCRFNQARFEDEAARVLAVPAGAYASLPEDAPTGPILIVGLPRSGTTLLEHMLSAHPALAAGGELPYWCFAGPALAASPLTPENLRNAADGYQAALRAIAKPPARVTDKMPLNALYAGHILLARPDALIIHCRRNLADTALSIQFTWFNPRMGFPTSLGPLAAYIATCTRVMAHWRAVLPPARFLEIDYEDLAASPAPVLRRVLDAAGLPFHAPCLHPETIRGRLRTPSKFQARQKLSTASVGRWRAYAPHMPDLAALGGTA